MGSTNDAYAQAYFGEDAPLQADALTVHPYLGLAAMGAFIDRAHQAGSCLLVVTRSSNPEGRALQTALTQAGAPVEVDILNHIAELNAQREGAVVPSRSRPRTSDMCYWRLSSVRLSCVGRRSGSFVLAGSQG